ncbi:MAG: hypothetical protein U9R14_02745 [Patescibacteria group bacterium]|nr:hypothetical protein [Patescibacteria group bacterium]
MKNNKNKIHSVLLIALLSAFCFMLSAMPTHASTFDPNYIISDSEILDFNSMSLKAIKEFLSNKNSFLYNYICPNADGIIKPAAEIIYDAAANNYDCSNVNLSGNPTEAEKKSKCIPVTINPKFLLVLLQKEQSLIEDSSPRQSQLDWATGYGCPDGDSCNPRWKGFGKQVNSAALQFFDYMVNPHHYTYKVNQTYTFTNPYSTTKEETTTVTPANQATAALYNYTPHVYNGNYNFFKIWQRYFSRNYPNGSLLQAEGEIGVWLIQNNKKRPFLTKGALTSRFDINKILTVNKFDLDAYEKGAPIKFPQYSLIRSPNGIIFLLVDDKRRGFASGEAFRKIGFNPEEVISASWEDINSYKEGAPITATSTYPTGALLQDKTTGGIHWVIEGTKAPIWDAVFLKTKFKHKKIISVSPEELTEYATIKPVVFDNGELVKSPFSPAVYIIINNEKRPITSGEIFESLGYKWENIITVSPKVLYLYDIGESITEVIGQ